MNKVLIDYYRCPNLADVRLNARLSEDSGYFRFGPDAVCYGRSTTGFRATQPSGPLYDSGEDVGADGSTLFLPFDPTEIISNLRLERYARNHSDNASNFWRRSLRNTYYFFRPLLHLRLRRHIQRAHLNGWRDLTFPHWPVDTTVETLCEKLLMLSMKARGVDRVPFVWFWPNGTRACLTLTHDVETEEGKTFCNELMSIDDSYGLKASFQLVPEERYKCSAAFIDGIWNRSFEVNIQDFNHDGHLFRDRKEFLRRAGKINEYAKAYRASGFRGASLYRNLDWYDGLQVSYDMSVPNVAHLDPQRGGCCTVMPYFIGDKVEIPVTTIQDYALFHFLNDYSLDPWKTQTQLILEKNGLISFIIHPDYIIEQKARSVYEDLLKFVSQLSGENKIWVALPGEIDRWWRARQEMSIVTRNGESHIEGPGSERATLAFARIVGDRLEYELQVK